MASRRTGRRVDDAFGGDVDFAQIIKEYGKDQDADERKYSPAKRRSVLAWRSWWCRARRT